MTVITGRDFKANQGKYIGLAHQGVDVIINSRKGAVRLTPVEDVNNSLSFLALSSRARKEHEEGTTLKFNSAADAQRWMDEL